MNLKTILVTAAVAATVVLSAGAAEAATIKFGTALYAQPGFGKIGYVGPGEWVDVQGCDRGYCYISKRGRDGFVKAFAIDFGRRGFGPDFGGHDFGGHDFGGHGFGNWPHHPHNF